jgi:hypothetical protein
MEREDQARVGGDWQPRAAPDSPPPAGRPGQRAYRIAAAVLAAAAVGVGLLLFLRVPPHGGDAQVNPPPNGQSEDNPFLFRGWGKPDLALVVTGQQYGYIQPCGCSPVQYGGLTRRYNFLQKLREGGWPVVAVDLGDIPDLPTHGSPQTLLKYVYSMKALKLMDYTAVSFGANEMRLPLDDALNSYALNNPSPRVVAANLLDRAKGGRFNLNVATWEVGGKGGTPKVGVFGLIGPSVEREGRDQTVKFHPKTQQVIDTALRELQARGAELNVLLYQGKLQEASACAGYCAKRRQADPKFPRLDVILCLTEEDEPPGGPDHAGETAVLRIGHKGRYVGVLGAFRTGDAAQPWRTRYQLVKIGPEYDTPKGKEKGHPLMDLLEDYALAVKDGNYLAKFPRRKHPVQLAFPKAEYVGSAECKRCHKSEYEVWQRKGEHGLGHAHAYQTLVDAKHPRNRQYDGECIVCHVVGFGIEKGFANELVKKPDLKDVGCESCHGPCSEHVDNTKNKEIWKAINPYRWEPNEKPEARIRRLNQIDIFCQKCHDIDNSVHFDFAKYWPQIVHPMPRRNRPPEPAPGK